MSERDIKSNIPEEKQEKQGGRISRRQFLQVALGGAGALVVANLPGVIGTALAQRAGADDIEKRMASLRSSLEQSKKQEAEPTGDTYAFLLSWDNDVYVADGNPYIQIPKSAVDNAFNSSQKSDDVGVDVVSGIYDPEQAPYTYYERLMVVHAPGVQAGEIVELLLIDSDVQDKINGDESVVGEFVRAAQNRGNEYVQQSQGGQAANNGENQLESQQVESQPAVENQAPAVESQPVNQQNSDGSSKTILELDTTKTNKATKVTFTDANGNPGSTRVDKFTQQAEAMGLEVKMENGVARVICPPGCDLQKAQAFAAEHGVNYIMPDSGNGGADAIQTAIDEMFDSGTGGEPAVNTSLDVPTTSNEVAGVSRSTITTALAATGVLLTGVVGTALFALGKIYNRSQEGSFGARPAARSTEQSRSQAVEQRPAPQPVERQRQDLGMSAVPEVDNRNPNMSNWEAAQRAKYDQWKEQEAEFKQGGADVMVGKLRALADQYDKSDPSFSDHLAMQAADVETYHHVMGVTEEGVGGDMAAMGIPRDAVPVELCEAYDKWNRGDRAMRSIIDPQNPLLATRI